MSPAPFQPDYSDQSHGSSPAGLSAQASGSRFDQPPGSRASNRDGNGAGNGSGNGAGNRTGNRLVGWIVGSPATAWAIIALLVTGAVLGVVMLAMARTPLLGVGQVMDHTHVARVRVQVADPITTEAQRQQARQGSPKVLVGDGAQLDELAKSVRNLPIALADTPTLGDVDAKVRERFALTPESFAVIRRQAEGGQTSPSWRRRSERLAEMLRMTPILDSESFQQQTLSGSDRLELVIEGTPSVALRGAELINAAGRRFDAQVRVLAVSAGFAGEELEAVVARVTSGAKPTFRLDRLATAQRAEDAANAVTPTLAKIDAGEVIYTRGEVIDSGRLELARAEAQAFWRNGPPHQRLTEMASWLVLGVLTAMGLGAYLATYAPATMARPRRVASLCVLVCGAIGLSCAIALIEPRALLAAAAVPAVMVAAVLVVAYERRTALAVASLVGITASLVLRLPAIAVLVPLAGVGLVVWQMRDLRHRASLIRAGLIAGLLLTCVAIVVDQLRLPMTQASIAQITLDALSTGAGVLLSCFLVLGLLPSIERAFGVLTPLSLIELRDPARPLLRQLQQRAPGTWAHSMNVASLAEQASLAIGADGLQAYVGALYHDVGKMNRPEMFVENQAGINRHDKLAPSVSLLMIVSHVADGLELAREHHVPRPLWHFIEAHHGSTVVEYFYHRACKLHDENSRLGGAGPGRPDERQYRYPGPKPRTKEVAVVMICDAAEGAARAMAEPSAIKIEQMVRAIADKRLHDGQFDQCELTMRELNTIVVTVAKALASIHHGRVAYPQGPEPRTGVQSPVAPLPLMPAKVGTSG